jgi:hypothetical protein
MNPAPLRTIGILLLPGVDERDVAGPWQVLSAWTHIFPDAGYNVVCVCHDGVPATCRLGLVIDVPHWFETMPPLGVLIHPGGTVEPLPYDQSTSLGCSINCNASWARGCPAASARGPPESTRCRRATVESAGESNRFAHPTRTDPGGGLVKKFSKLNVAIPTAAMTLSHPIVRSLARHAVLSGRHGRDMRSRRPCIRRGGCAEVKFGNAPGVGR